MPLKTEWYDFNKRVILDELNLKDLQTSYFVVGRDEVSCSCNILCDIMNTMVYSCFTKVPYLLKGRIQRDNCVECYLS